MERSSRDKETFIAYATMYEWNNSKSSAKIIRAWKYRTHSSRTSFFGNTITRTSSTAWGSEAFCCHNIKSSHNIVWKKPKRIYCSCAQFQSVCILLRNSFKFVLNQITLLNQMQLECWVSA